MADIKLEFDEQSTDTQVAIVNTPLFQRFVIWSNSLKEGMKIIIEPNSLTIRTIKEFENAKREATLAIDPHVIVYVYATNEVKQIVEAALKGHTFYQELHLDKLFKGLPF